MNFHAFGLKVTMTAALVAGFGTIASMPAQAAIVDKTFSMGGTAVLKDLGSDRWLLDFLADPSDSSADGRARVGNYSQIANPPLGTEFPIKDVDLVKSGSDWSFSGNLDWFTVNQVSFTLKSFILSQTRLGGYEASLTGIFQELTTPFETAATNYGYFASSPLLSANLSSIGTTFQADFRTVKSTPAIPTPALLPGLIGLGASIVRKRCQAKAIAT
jgi:hypothetical protein